MQTAHTAVTEIRCVGSVHLWLLVSQLYRFNYSLSHCWFSVVIVSLDRLISIVKGGDVDDDITCKRLPPSAYGKRLTVNR
jgi:hypothetical protein